MGTASKEERVLELFLNEPSKQWHFFEIMKTAGISEGAASKWLNKLMKEKIIAHITPKGKMPYFIGNFNSENYRNKKKIYALQKLYETGLMARLQRLDAKAVIVFGSFSRADWNSKSDIDLFVLGDPGEFRSGILWKDIGFQGKAREIEVHSYKTIEETKKIQSGLMKNIVKGYFVKGDIYDIAEVEA